MISLTLLNVHITTPYPLDLGANAGSSLRGAFYEALRTMYDTGVKVQSRDAADTNPVAWLLRLEDDETSGGKDVPRPIAIRPPLTEAATTTTFGVSLYGNAQAYLNLVLSALNAMQIIGMGRGRSTFNLHQIDQVDALTYQAFPLLNDYGQQLGELRSSPTTTAYQGLAQMLNPDELTVHFLTPTRIIQAKKLCHIPTFQPWFQRLLERIRLISELYTDAPIWIPFKALLADASQVNIIENKSHWVEMWSGSRRDGQIRPTSGFVGEVRYRGPLSALLPWLILGQALQVGKNTIKGGGWYRVAYEWR
jgi:hypothetical protein